MTEREQQEALAEELLAQSDVLYERLPSLFSEEELEVHVAVLEYREHEVVSTFGRLFTKTLMGMLQGLDTIVTDTTTNPGWSIILDPVLCPPAWLPWCAQIYGVVLPVGLTVAEQRERINLPPQESRGSLSAFDAAVAFTLTGAKELFVEEQAEGYAYKVVCTTIASETPDEAATYTALLTQKPGGIAFFYEPISGPIWDEATITWSEVSGEYEYKKITIGEVT